MVADHEQFLILVRARRHVEDFQHAMRAKWFLTLSLAAGALCAAGSVVAAGKDAEFKSGLYAGDKLASFKCLGITGPNKGKPLCYI